MTQSQALEIMKTGANIFLTGEPGSGKTYVVNQYVAYLRSQGVEPAITASTGIAATHLGGLTVHSWSGLGVKENLSHHDLALIAANERVAKKIQKARVLIIDEVSMLAPNLLTMVEAICRQVKNRPEPFGGLQTILVGDFFQLPPVTRARPADGQQAALVKESTLRFAFQSPVWARTKPVVCYLSEQHRQEDGVFLSLLSAIRRNVFQDEHRRHLDSRRAAPASVPESIPKFFSHNADVDRVNDRMLAKLPGRARTFEMSAAGPKPLVAALKKGCLSPEMLALKVGAIVMFTKNDHRRGWYVNGTVGEVMEFDEVSGYPVVAARGGRRIEVAPADWTLEENGVPRAKITQLPLRLAWAITIHKSQGMSLDAAVMDLSGVFEFGQGYVALSRVRRLSGLFLLGFNERAFLVDPMILEKDEAFRRDSVKSEADLARIPPAQLQKTQAEFIIDCGGVLAGSGGRKKKPEKPDTYLETTRLWQQGKNLAEIAAGRGLKEGTIVGHLEKLIQQKKISRAELRGRLAAKLIEAWPEIKSVFQECGFERLAPAFERFAGKYSYEELRICRAAFGQPASEGEAGVDF